MVDRLQKWSAGRAEGADVAHGWLAEQAGVFAIELAGALVADLEGSPGGIQTVNEHARSGSLQAELFLILKGTHGGQCAEMMVERGQAHARDLREIFHT